jgi:hypothetical protein
MNCKSSDSTLTEVSHDITRPLVQLGLCSDTALLVESFVVRETRSECHVEYFTKLSKFIERKMVENNKLRGYWGEDKFVHYPLDPTHEDEIFKNESAWGYILDDIYVNSGKLVNSYYRTLYFYDEQV